MAEFPRSWRLVVASVFLTAILLDDRNVSAKSPCSHRCDVHYQASNTLTCSYTRTKDEYYDIRLKTCGLVVPANKKKRLALGYLNLEDIPSDFLSSFGADDTDDFQFTYSNMPTFPFAGLETLASKLVTLGLEHNSITDWNADAIASLKFTDTLTKIYLDGNSLSFLPDGAFDKFTALKTINLPKNKLTVITKTIFRLVSYPNLSTLILRDNAIQFIAVGAFDSLTSLTKLDLSGNKLAALFENTFAASVFAKLQDFRLGGNPFFGYTFNKWLFTKIQEKEAAYQLLTYSNATCTRPKAGSFSDIFTSLDIIDAGILTITYPVVKITTNTVNSVTIQV